MIYKRDSMQKESAPGEEKPKDKKHRAMAEKCRGRKVFPIDMLMPNLTDENQCLRIGEGLYLSEQDRRLVDL